MKIVLLLVAVLVEFFISGCSGRDWSARDAETERNWQAEFDKFVHQLPPCPNGDHPLIEGENYYPLFGGSCIKCRKALGTTTTKVNSFLGTRSTVTAKSFTCSAGCSYNVCGECAK